VSVSDINTSWTLDTPLILSVGATQILVIEKYVLAISNELNYQAVPVVDGNVIRVIARLRAISENPKDSAIIKRFW